MEDALFEVLLVFIGEQPKVAVSNSKNNTMDTGSGAAGDPAAMKFSRDVEDLIDMTVKEQLPNTKIMELLNQTIGKLQHEGQSDRDIEAMVTHQEVVIFDNDEAGAVTVEKVVQSLGFPNTKRLTNISLVLARLRHGLAKGIFVAYHGNSNLGALLVQEILEMRDLHRINLVLIADSEDLGRKFRNKYPHILLDTIVNRAEPRQILRPKMWQIWGHQQTEQKLVDALYDIRALWRAQRAGQKKVALNEHHIQDEVSFLQQRSTSYLVLSEVFLKDLMRGRKDNVHGLAEELKQWIDLSVDVVLSIGTFIAITQTTEEAAEWLIEHAPGHRYFSTEKAYHLGKVLTKWKMTKQLKVLLEQWHLRPDLQCEASFFFVMAQYFKCLKSDKQEMACMKQAVVCDPLAIDHIAALADTYARQQQVSLAGSIWKMLARSPLPSEYGMRNRYVQFLFEREEFDHCRQEINDYIKAGMSSPVFDELLVKLAQQAA